MKLATHGIDKLKIWFMPPGWRPRNLPPYPKNPPHTALTQVKYVTRALPGSKYYLIFQLIANMFLMLLVIHHQSVLSVIEKVVMSVFLYLAVTLWAAILESKTWARNMEILRIIIQSVFLAYILNVHSMPNHYAVINGLMTFIFLFWFLIKVEGPTKNSQSQTLNDLQTQ
jgi:alkylglycerol monooxygenase